MTLPPPSFLHLYPTVQGVLEVLLWKGRPEKEKKIINRHLTTPCAVLFCLSLSLLLFSPLKPLIPPPPIYEITAFHVKSPYVRKGFIAILCILTISPSLLLPESLCGLERIITLPKHDVLKIIFFYSIPNITHFKKKKNMFRFCDLRIK